MNLVILDRDGVINVDSDTFIKAPEEWKPIPGSLDAIVRLNRAGYHVVVATNQSGVARRLLSFEDLNAIHERMQGQLAEIGGQVDAIFFCPCHPKNHCKRSKPRPGMLHDIAARLRMPLAGVPVVGDSLRDIQAARAVSARPILVRTGNGKATAEDIEATDEGAVEVYDDLASAVDALLDE